MNFNQFAQILRQGCDYPNQCIQHTVPREDPSHYVSPACLVLEQGDTLLRREVETPFMQRQGYYPGPPLRTYTADQPSNDLWSLSVPLDITPGVKAIPPVQYKPNFSRGFYHMPKKNVDKLTQIYQFIRFKELSSFAVVDPKHQSYACPFFGCKAQYRGSAEDITKHIRTSHLPILYSAVPIELKDGVRFEGMSKRHIIEYLVDLCYSQTQRVTCTFCRNSCMAPGEIYVHLLKRCRNLEGERSVRRSPRKTRPPLSSRR